MDVTEFNIDYRRRLNMKCNVGNTDRLVRGIIGVLIVALGVMNSSWLGAIGLIPLATAALGWCPAYIPFKTSTCCKENCNS